MRSAPAGAAGSQITAGHGAPHRPRIDPDALGDLDRGEDRSGLEVVERGVGMVRHRLLNADVARCVVCV